MSNSVQNSLHALIMAARKSMMPDELAAHIETITDEITAMQAKSKTSGAFDDIFEMAGMEGDFAAVKNLSGTDALKPVEIRGNPRVMTEKLAKKMHETALVHLKLSLVMRLGEFPELASMFRTIAETEHEWAGKISDIAEKIPSTK